MDPNEIAQITFEKHRMVGYDPEDVEAYLGELAQGVAKLLDENKSLETKLQILAERVKEYRKDEDSIKEVLISAQKRYNELVNEGQAKADELIRQAQAQAESIVGNTHETIESEKEELVRVQQEVTAFKSKLLSLYKQHLDLITALPEIKQEEQEAPQPKEEAPEMAPDTTESPDTEAVTTSGEAAAADTVEEAPRSRRRFYIDEGEEE